MSHWGSSDRKGGGGYKSHRRGTYKEKGVKEETGTTKGKNDERLDIEVWIIVQSIENSKKCQ